MADYLKLYNPDYFNSRPNLDDELNRGHFFEFARWLTENFEFNTIADVGCGYGNLLKQLNSRGKIATGIDISEYILNKLKIECPEIDIVVSALPELKEVTQHYDIVVCYQVLEHLEEMDALRAIERMSRLANKYLILSICTDLIRGAGDDTHILLKPREWWIEKLQPKYNLDFSKSYINSEEEFIIKL